MILPSWSVTSIRRTGRWRRSAGSASRCPSAPLSSTDGSAEIIGIARTLAGRAPDPAAVEIREPTLDDIFLTLTGKPAQKAKAGPVGAQAPVGTQAQGTS